MRYVVGKPKPPNIRSVRKGGWTIGGWDDDTPATASTAHVEERDQFEDTGLLDADGNRLYRERDPIGFKVR